MVDNCYVHTDSNVLSLDSLLEAERRQLEQERGDLADQIRSATERMTAIDGRLHHVKALLEASDRSPSGRQPAQLQKRDIADMAADILAERNREPMYYKDLTAEVQARGGDIGGATPWATLAARLVRDDRFVRPVRKGFYALRSDFPNAPNVGARKRPRRAA